MKKRMFSMLLALCLVCSLLPLGGFAAENGMNSAAAETTANEEDADVYVCFTSDVHNKSSNESANRLTQWINNVTAKVGKGIDAFGSCGDYGAVSGGESAYWTNAQSVMNAAMTNEKVSATVFSTGNHEFYPGNYNSTTQAAAQNIKRIGEGRSTPHYIIYAFGPKNWDNSRDEFKTEDITIIDNYLAGLSETDRAKPIFILSHFPIHSYGSGGWGGRSTANADQLRETLNKYGDQGYELYFLWGHNHTVSDTHYDEVITGSIDGKAISFTYLAAGCMSDSEYGTGSAFVKGKGLLVGVKGDDVVSMRYYDSNANDVTENAVPTPTPTVQPTAEPTTQPGTDSEVAVTPSTSNPSASATINAGETLAIKVTNGSSTSAYDFTASLSGSGVAEIQGSATVNISRGATGTFTVKGLSAGSVDITIQNNQSTSSYTRKATIHLTVVSAEPTPVPTTEPTAEPIIDSEVAVTPSTSNPSASATINAGDTLAIQVTNGSSYSAYNFTASCSNDDIAQVQGSAAVNIAAGGSGTFTVKGLAEGEVDITVQNNGSYSVRKATIHLTVIDAGPAACTHENTILQGAVDATCTAAGFTGNTVCAACGETLVTGVMIPATGHSFGEWTLVTAATCTVAGSEQRVCSVCGEKETRAIPAPGHGALEIHSAAAATCTAAGYTGDRVCTVCGEVVQPGTVIPALGHDTELRSQKAASCTEAGYTGDLVCKVCGETVTEGKTIPALGHDWGEWITVQEPTTTAAGLEQRVCARCDETESRVIDRLPMPLAILSHPADVTADLGDLVTFTVEAQGEGLIYQWFYRSPGKTTWYPSAKFDGPVATVEMTAKRDGQSYYCVVTDENGESLSSEAATMTLTPPAAEIISHPQNQAVKLGANAVFAVETTGKNLAYQWQYRQPGKTSWYDSSAEGADTPTLTIQATSRRDGQSYRCIVTDEHGNVLTSEAATLTIAAPALQILTQPEDQTVSLGENAVFAVTASGEGLTYQWQYRSAGKTSWYTSSAAGAQTPELTIAATAKRNGQSYRCIITDADGNTVISDAAALIIG